MTELKIEVERIVRPIRASERRKEAMRHDLWSHLVGAVETELTHDEEEAVRRAIERLGPTDVVRRELQASVPAWERVLFRPFPIVEPAEQWMDERADERPSAHAGRVTAWLLALSALVTPLVILRQESPAQLLTFAACFFGAAGAWFFAIFFCFRRMRMALYGEDESSPSRLRATMWALTSGVVAGLLGFLLLRAQPLFDHVMVFDSGAHRRVIAAAFLAPFLTTLLAVTTASERRRRREWGQLEIDG